MRRRPGTADTVTDPGRRGSPESRWWRSRWSQPEADHCGYVAERSSVTGPSMRPSSTSWTRSGTSTRTRGTEPVTEAESPSASVACTPGARGRTPGV